MIAKVTAAPRTGCMSMTAGFVVQSLSSGICYVVAQCLGGILGAAGAFYSLPGQCCSSACSFQYALPWNTLQPVPCLLTAGLVIA